jgi:hypothetical protein
MFHEVQGIFFFQIFQVKELANTPKNDQNFLIKITLKNQTYMKISQK